MTPFSVFDPGLCCNHRWQPRADYPEKSLCLDCPATCKRDKHGAIIEYDHDGQIKRKVFDKRAAA